MLRLHLVFITAIHDNDHDVRESNFDMSKEPSEGHPSILDEGHNKPAPKSAGVLAFP